MKDRKDRKDSDINEYAQWSAELARNIDRQIGLVEKRLTTMRAALQRIEHGVHVAPSAEVVASEVLQLAFLASKLDQLTDITKENAS